MGTKIIKGNLKVDGQVELVELVNYYNKDEVDAAIDDALTNVSGENSVKDWNEPDESVPTAIKNKPFGYVTEMVDVVPAGTYNFYCPNPEITTDIICYPSFDCIYDAEYTVSFNGNYLGQARPDQRIDIPDGQFYFAPGVLVITGGNYAEGPYEVHIQKSAVVHKKLSSEWLNVQDDIYSGNLNDPVSCGAVLETVQAATQTIDNINGRINQKEDLNRMRGYLASSVSNYDAVTIVGCDQKISGAHIIPSTINGYPVTTIDDSAFESCASLNLVTIPTGVTSIGDNAFKDCVNLKSIIIPDGVTSIGDYAFCNCTSLESVTIPASVTYIGHDAFIQCYSLTSVTLGDDVTTIYPNTFSACTSLESVTLGKSLKAIAPHAFASCHALTSVVIPTGVTTINMYAFDGCTGLASVTLPATISQIAPAAFNNCPNLKHVYYAGTEDEWNDITADSIGNDALTSATIHYNQASATKQYVLDKITDSVEWDNILNKPDIEENDSGMLEFADESENVIMRVSKAGLETTNIIADNIYDKEAVNARIAEALGDIDAALDAILAIQKELIGVTLITFTIDGTEYQAEEGMTLIDWAESAYGSGTHAVERGSALGYPYVYRISDSCGVSDTTNGMPINANTVIVAGKAYYHVD